MSYRCSLPSVARLLLSIACCASCGSPSGPTRYAPAESLNGSWRWVSSLDVRTMQLHTPTTAGFEATLGFAADSARSGTFTYTRTGQSPVAGRFSIYYEDAPGADFLVLERGVDFLSKSGWLGVGKDTLHLGGVMELGFNSTYARASP